VVHRVVVENVGNTVIVVIVVQLIRNAVTVVIKLGLAV
jgi:hypothetical protein